MYWPTGNIRHLREEQCSSPDDTLLDFRFNRRTNLFVTYSERSITLWSSEPTCRIARVERTQGSLKDYGMNKHIEWSGDGHSVYVSTTRNHILKYDLAETESTEPVGSSMFISPQTPRINIEVSHILQSFPPGAGQGEVYDASPSAIMTSTNIPELLFRNGGIMRLKSRIIGQAYLGGNNLTGSQKGLLVAIADDSPTLVDTTDSETRPFSGFVRIPSKIPDVLVWKGSRTQAFPPHGWPCVDADGEDQVDVDRWSWEDVGVRLSRDESVTQFRSTKMTSILCVITSHGNAFLVFPSTQHDDGQLWWDKKRTANRSGFWSSVQVFTASDQAGENQEGEKATSVDLNPSFGLCTVGTSKGSLVTVKLDLFRQSTAAWTCSCLDDQDKQDSMKPAIQSMSWTTDGYALAVQMDRKWALFSPLGDLLFCYRDAGTVASNGSDEPEPSPSDLSGTTPLIGHSAAGLAWLPGNYGLMMLKSKGPLRIGLEIVPFARSSSTMQQDHLSPYRSLVLHDEIRVFRGADRSPDDLLDTNKNLFETVKIPLAYAIHHWPIRYTAISLDGTLFACAGRNGLTHYSFSSGRWKLFAEIAEETSFSVRGGMVWYHHVLIAAVHINGHHEIHLYSRDLDLDLRNVLHIERMAHSVLCMSLDNDCLLIYTSNNVLHHFLVQPTSETVQLKLCQSIPLADFITSPNRVKSITWAVPQTHRVHGNKVELSAVASILVLLEGRLMVIHREKSGYRSLPAHTICLSYDGPQGNAGVIWSDTGQQIQLIHRLTSNKAHIKKLECSSPEAADGRDGGSLFAIIPSLGLAVKLQCSISEAISATKPSFDILSKPILFLPTLLKNLIDIERLDFAVVFGGKFAHLPYFGHVLEVLLLQALEQEYANTRNGKDADLLSCTDRSQAAEGNDLLTSGLSTVVQFLDYFPQSRAAVIACARKCEAELWPLLFQVVGTPRELFNSCMETDTPALKLASSLLVIIHTLDQANHLQEDIRRLLTAAFDMHDLEASTCIAL